MALKYPDELKHNNPDYAVADAEFVRGGGRVVANLTALYALTAKLDQLKERVTKVYVTSEAKYYNLKDIANVGNANGWEVESSGGGAAIDYSTDIETDKLSTTKVSAIKTLYDWAVAKFAAAIHSHTKADVGLGNVDNTSDANKPVSTATQTALNAKSDTTHNHTLAGLSEKSYNSLTDKPTIPAALDYSTNIETDKLSTTKVSAIKTLYDWAVAKFAAAIHSHTKADVGLGNVDNTSDANKPVSIATQTALNAKSDTTHNHTLAGLSEKSYNSLTDKPNVAKEMLISKSTFNSIAEPGIYKNGATAKQITGYRLMSNATDFQITIGGTSYTKDSVFPITLAANAELLINDVNIANTYNLGNVILIIE